MATVLKELTPLLETDCFYVVERYKSEFLFPLHTHRDCELNFLENARGARRVVGDSVEEIDEYELTLITGPELEHAWEQGNCTSRSIREITVQFSPGMFPETILRKRQFASIRTMLSQAGSGLAFSQKTIMKVYSMLDGLSSITDPFEQTLQCLLLLYRLSQAEDSRILASVSYAHSRRELDTHRVQLIKEYINDHYKDDLHLDLLAELVGMAPSAFSRFFHQQTGHTVMDYIIDVRIAVAARLLIDTDESIASVCRDCGFNNISNFNRTFKTRRGHSPRDYRTAFRNTHGN